MKLKKGLGFVFTVASIGGVVYSIYLTAKKAPEAQKAKEEALRLKRETTGDENAQLTKKESIKVQAGFYTPVFLTTIASIGRIIVAQYFPQSALNDLKKVHETYKEVNRKMNGEKAEQKIEEITKEKLVQNETPNDNKKETFVIQFYGRDILFETTLLDVMEGEYEANRYFRGRGELSFNELLQCFHVDPIEHGHFYGWEENLGGMFYGYCWIDFNHRRGMLGDKPVTFIEFPFYPHPLDEDECKNDMEHLSSEIANHGIEGHA